MAQRTVTDALGRTWVCDVDASRGPQVAQQGIDVTLSCTTSSVPNPVLLTVGWAWRAMAVNGLARMISRASPVLRP